MLEATFAGGVMLGLASALHCGAMCGGIACGAMLLLGAPTTGERYRQLAIMQAGRVTTYTLIGAAGAWIGAGLLANNKGINFHVMQWAAAAALMWMGMVMAGFAPRLALIDRGMMHISAFVDSIAKPLRAHRVAGPYALGLGWGLNACPMVYSAAFFASLTGSSSAGATFMAGFGLGTVPAVMAAASGYAMLKSLQSNRAANMAVGALLVALAFVSVYVPWPTMAGLCLTQ
jgi:uncharacterized protein